MGWFSDLFGSDNNSSDETEYKVKIEGRKSENHRHKDGSNGHDIYAAKVTYKNNEKISEKNANFGHISVNENGDQKNHVK